MVRKTELHSRLWPDSFVSDAALTSLVKELRRVLRDLAGGAPLIKTTHGVGYAFDHACAPEALRATTATFSSVRAAVTYCTLAPMSSDVTRWLTCPSMESKYPGVMPASSSHARRPPSRILAARMARRWMARGSSLLSS